MNLADIKELNRKVNVPLLLTKLGADPKTIKKLRGNDYRCPCFFRGGDNLHGCGITFNSTKGKWLLTDFTHKEFGNIDFPDFMRRYFNYDFKTSLDIMEQCIGEEIKDSNNVYGGTYEYQLKTISKSVLELFEYGLHPYLKERGYTPQTIQHFGIGYSAIGELIDRIVIPIVNEDGELVAIQGRSFVNEEPRYLYLDGSGSQAKETLYNLFPAKKYIQEKGWVMVVEGATSVWRAHQYGLKNVVATLSTSVTDRQLQLLKTLDVKIVIAFDFDEDTQAGQMATIKLAKRLKELNYQKGVYTLNIGSLGLSGAIDDLTYSEAKQALKTIKKLF